MEAPTDCGTRRHPPMEMSARLLWLLSKLQDGRLMTHLTSLLTIHGGRVEKAKGVKSLGRQLFGLYARLIPPQS